MISSAHKNKMSAFIATMFVIVISMLIMILSVVLSQSVYTYSDSVFRRELRIQTRLNLRSCLDTVTIMFAKDYFLSGSISLQEFGCVADVIRSIGGTVVINATSTLSGIDSVGIRTIATSFDSVKLESDQVD